MATDSPDAAPADARPIDILCLAPNPALQITLRLDRVALGDVNRATEQTNSLGGKGQNFAVAAKQYYGSADRVTLLQILGGPTGDQIQAMEDSEGFRTITVRTTLPTRACTTCLDVSTGEMTEMVGVSGVIDASAVAEYERVAVDLLRDELPPRALALCGTFPPGLAGDTVARIVAARAARTLVFVDAVKDVQPVLATGCIDILKVNSSEALAILASQDSRGDGCQTGDDAQPAALARPADFARVAATLAARFSIGIVAVTNGPATAYLADGRTKQCFAFGIPDLLASTALGAGKYAKPALLNPLGAGDTCSAVMLGHLLSGASAVDAFAAGLAAASASCLVAAPNCIFDLGVMRRIRDRITVTKL